MDLSGRLLAVVTSTGFADEGRAPAAAAPLVRDARESHERMVRKLAEVAEQAKQENPFVGEGVATRLAQRMADLPQDAPPAHRWWLEHELGNQLLRLGRTDEAIDHLGRARDLLPAIEGAVVPERMRETLYDLAVAYLRLGENQNCVCSQTAESCVFPIQGGGVHRDRAGSTQAAAILEQYLKVAPDDYAARWLFALAWMTLGEYPDKVPPPLRLPAETPGSSSGFPPFQEVAGRVGLATRNLSGGAVFDDFDGDERLDLLTSTLDPHGQIEFFRNDGDGRFSRRTVEAGLEGIFGGLNVTSADYDNDGDLDALVLRGGWFGRLGRHPNSLLRNDGNGTFVDVSYLAGIAGVDYPTQTAAWGDYDHDGDLDLYVGNEATPSLPYPCQLFRNEGNGTFVDVAKQAGVENLRTAKGVAFGDYDGDRWPDLYVSNVGDENRLYRNLGNGTFVDVAPKLGVTRPIRSFPLWFFDFDNDGALDLFVASYWANLRYVAPDLFGAKSEAERSCLYRGDGKGGFTEVGAELGLTRITNPMGCNYGDLDNDGWLDFHLGTGNPGYDGLMPNLTYRNAGGRRFEDVTSAGRFGHLQKGHAVCFADFDNDGDQDVFEQMGGAYPGDAFPDVLYENPGFGNHWLKVRLVGTRSNRCAIGARLHLEIDEDGTRRSLWRHVGTGGSFGANPLRQEVGLGKATEVALLEVFWPTTETAQRFERLPADQFIQIVEGDPTLKAVALPPCNGGGR